MIDIYSRVRDKGLAKPAMVNLQQLEAQKRQGPESCAR